MRINVFGFSRYSEDGDQIVTEEDILKALTRDAMNLGFLKRFTPFHIQMFIWGDNLYGFEIKQAKGSIRFTIAKDLLSYFNTLGFNGCKIYHNVVSFPKSELENLVMMYKMKNLL